MSVTLKYHPEIDGLRSLAVLAVVFYHVGVTVGGRAPFSGGYIGVDVFFVISGYLIGQIILVEMQDGRFSFARFYLRRARRILPALLVVIAAVLLYGWVYLLPRDYRELGGSGLAALAFASNVWFWLDGGYSAGPSALKPLLHSWSLAVEEQFYIAFPLIVLALRRWARPYLPGILVLIALTSLQLADFGASRFPDAGFYLPFARLWELLVGVLLAWLELTRGRGATTGLWGLAAAPVGLFLILNAVVFMTDQTPHPGQRTLLPVLGTALVIWFARPGEVVGALLSLRLPVWIGRLSYSLYLWHWPLIACRNLISPRPIGTGEGLAIVAVSVALAAASYHLVEQPCRNPRRLATGPFLSLIGVASVLVAAACAAIFLRDGFPGRAGQAGVALAGTDMPRLLQDGRDCQNRPMRDACRFGPPEAPLLVNIGDSHAGVLAPDLQALAARHDMGFLSQSSDGCPYTGARAEIWRGDQPWAGCNRDNLDRHAALLALPPATLVLSGRWPALLSGQGYDNGEGGIETRSGLASWTYQVGLLRPMPPGTTPELTEALRDSLRELLAAGHRLVLVYPVPENGWNVPQAIHAQTGGLPVSQIDRVFARVDLSTSYARYRARAAATEALFDGLGDLPGLIRVHPDRLFCSEVTGRCDSHDDRAIFYHDDDHLSHEGNRRLAAQIERQLQAAGALPRPDP